MAGKQRIAYLDLTKLWAIFLVCTGHAFTMLSVGYQAQIFGMLYTFHMALFMLMCGYFSHHALSMPFGPFVKKKALQLLVPTVVYVGLNLLSTWVVTGNCPTGFIRDEAIGGMWFLRTLFACYLFAWLVLRLPGTLWLKIIGSIVFALLFPHGYYLQFNYMLIFFWLGYVMKGHDGWLQAHTGGALVVSLLIFLLVPWQKPAVLTYDVLFHDPLQLPVQFIGGLAGSIMSITLMMLICRVLSRNWKDRLADIGRFTLAIYGLQGVLLQNVVERIWSIDESVCSADVQQYVVAPVVGVITVIVCYLLARLFTRTRITAQLFLGISGGPLPGGPHPGGPLPSADTSLRRT